MPEEKFLKPDEPAQTQMLNHLWELQRKNGYIKDADISQLAGKFQLSSLKWKE